jgi:hypothetical protein
MNTPNHTPETWHLSGSEVFGPPGSSEPIAILNKSHPNYQENFRLILAAPRLLRVLKGVLVYAQRTPVGSPTAEVVQDAEDVIRRIEDVP